MDEIILLNNLCFKIIPWKNILKNSSKFTFLFVGSVGVVQQENIKGRELALPVNLKKDAIYIWKVAK